MKKTIVVLSTAVALGLAMIGLYSSCGSTDSDVGPAEALGQFFNQSCSGGNCLTLTAPNAVPADGRFIGGFIARLVDASGTPVVGQELCFAFENPGVATIIEPTNACGLTDTNGSVSGQFQVGSSTGSFQLVANAPGGFGLRARKTISFGTSTSTPSGGAGCTSGAQCTSGECSSSLAVCGGPACCLGGSGSPCTANGQCSSQLVCQNGTCSTAATPAPASTATPNPSGATCTNGSQCSSGFCGGSPAHCLGAQGDPCAVNADCAPSFECSSGTCAVPPTPSLAANGAACTANGQCASACCCSGAPRTCEANAGSCTSAPFTCGP
jgi:hypothetical protein